MIFENRNTPIFVDPNYRRPKLTNARATDNWKRPTYWGYVSFEAVDLHVFALPIRFSISKKHREKRAIKPIKVGAREKQRTNKTVMLHLWTGRLLVERLQRTKNVGEINTYLKPIPTWFPPSSIRCVGGNPGARGGINRTRYGTRFRPEKGWKWEGRRDTGHGD
jgi:hypothetical protein